MYHIIHSRKYREARSNYACHQLRVCFIFLQSLAAPFRWSDSKTVYGMHVSILSEIWDVITHFIDKWGHVLNSFRSDLINERVEIYAESIRYSG